MAATVINKHMKQTNCQENITKQKNRETNRVASSDSNRNPKQTSSYKR